MSKNIVVIGSCMIDFTSYVSRLPKPGETLAGSEFQRTVGGKGANQCVAAAKLGASTTLIASLGSDIFGTEYLQMLQSLNINTSYVKFQDDISSGIAQITVSKNGENTIVIIKGANALLTPDIINNAQNVIENAAVLLAQFETPLDVTLHALKLHKGHGISIVNGSPAVTSVDTTILKNCDIFCINETEAETITEIPKVTLLNGQEALNKLFKIGCNIVIITLGCTGAIFANRDNPTMVHIPVKSVEPIDTTGAGDAFLGALAYFITHHSSLQLQEQISRACQIATRSVLKMGTQSSFPSRHELPDEIFF